MSSAGERLKLEALVAHRELQVIRAGAFGRGERGRRWLAERQRKLDQARQQLARLEEAGT